MRLRFFLWCGAALAGPMLPLSGCGEHLEKDRETLVSPSQRGTEAEQQVEGPVRHGEAPGDTNR